MFFFNIFDHFQHFLTEFHIKIIVETRVAEKVYVCKQASRLQRNFKNTITHPGAYLLSSSGFVCASTVASCLFAEWTGSDDPNPSPKLNPGF